MALCDKDSPKSWFYMYLHWTVSFVKMFKLFFYPSIDLLYTISFLANLVSTLVFLEPPKKNFKKVSRYS